MLIVFDSASRRMLRPAPVAHMSGRVPGIGRAGESSQQGSRWTLNSGSLALSHNWKGTKVGHGPLVCVCVFQRALWNLHS